MNVQGVGGYSMRRRTVLEGLLSASFVGAGGYVAATTGGDGGVDESTDERETSADGTAASDTGAGPDGDGSAGGGGGVRDSPSVVEHRGARPEWTVTVDVLVVDEAGERVGGEAVHLIDGGGTLDRRVGRTDDRGRVTFVEGVGPAPCNGLGLGLPDRGIERSLGCRNGGQTITRRVVVGEGGGDTPAADGEKRGTAAGPLDVPVVDNRGSSPARTLTVDCTVLDRDGDPLGGVTVVLRDSGGGGDLRRGSTDRHGRVRFLEGVGPAPCNRQQVRVPDLGVERDLGCNNGGKRIEVRLSPAGSGGRE